MRPLDNYHNNNIMININPKNLIYCSKPLKKQVILNHTIIKQICATQRLAVVEYQPTTSTLTTASTLKSLVPTGVSGDTQYSSSNSVKIT